MGAMLRATVAGLAILAFGHASAQGTSPKNALIDALGANLAPKAQEAIDSFKNYQVDMVMPDTPAFTLLGTSPQTVIDAYTPRDLALSLAQGVADRDKRGGGIGFDVAPYMLFAGERLTLEEYRSRRWIPIVANTQLSFAVQDKSDAAAGTKDVRGAVGLVVPLIDRGDPRLSKDLETCFVRAALGPYEGLTAEQRALRQKEELAMLAKLGTLSEPERTEKTQAFLRERLDAISPGFDKCRSDYKQRRWASTRWVVGWGQAFADDGSGFGADSRGLWTTYSMPIGADPRTPSSNRALLALFASRIANEMVDDATDPRGFYRRTKNVLGVRYRFGSERRIFSAEASRTYASLDTGQSEGARKVAIGGEFKISDNLWLVATVGGEGGLARGKGGAFALGSIKFGATQQRTGAFD